MNLRAIFSLLLGLAGLARGQTGSLTADTTTYSASGGQVVLTARVQYPSTFDYVSNFELKTEGSGYTSSPSVVVSGGGGSGAVASIPYDAKFIRPSDGHVLEIRLVAGGSGYTSAPSVVISGGGGTGATAVANLPTNYSSLGYIIQLPENWAMVSVSGPNVPNLRPDVGSMGALEFAYTTVPSGSATFAVTVSYPANLNGGQTFIPSATIRPASTAIPIAPLILSAIAGPPAISTQPASQVVTAGLNATFSVLAASPTPITYQWRKDGVALPGATNATLTLTNVNASSSPGGYSVVVANSTGTVTSNTATLTVVTPATAPTIAVQPISQSLTAGSPLVLSVVAAGTAPLSFQWKKNGVALAGVTGSSFSVANVGGNDAGNYTVTVTNSAGSVTSNAATISVGTVSPPPPEPPTEAPRIATQPTSQTVTTGATLTLSIAATSTVPLTYQWSKDGRAIAGATSATLTLTAVTTAAAGSYAVTVTNSAGSIQSNAATLAVSDPVVQRPGGAYFGPLANGGSFSVFVRPDQTAVFLAYAPPVALISRDLVVDATGHFRVTAAPLTASASNASGTTRAAATPDYVVEGAFSATGFSGTIAALNATLTSAALVPTGVSAGFAGYYHGAVDRGSATCHAIVGAGGDAYFLSVVNGVADAGRGTVEASGGLDITTSHGAHVNGGASGNGVLTASVTASGAPALTFFSANDDTRTAVERLVNVSTRSQVSSTSELIAGFVVSGDAAKPVLVRAIGPSLTGFGVNNALPAARVQVFRGSTLVATGDNWGDGPNAAAVAASAARVGAFNLASSSRDAALLLTLEPAAYTAVVSGQGGAAGAVLIEAYDASEGPIPRTQRIVNISTRSLAGSADATLITGFVISGLVPKRVLVRGVGPGLSQFGVTGVLTQPRLGIYSGTTLIAENAGWSSSPDASAIADASAQVGAFAFAPDSRDSAVMINLGPGAYTTQVAAPPGTSGTVLLEVYELP